MARFPIQPTTRGHVEVSRRKFRPGPLDEAAARDLTTVLEVLPKAINGGLSLGDGEDGARAGNLSAQFRAVTTPATPDTTFPVPHGLARRAVGYLPTRKGAACDVYDAPDHGWSDDTIWLRASVGSVAVTLLVF